VRTPKVKRGGSKALEQGGESPWTLVKGKLKSKEEERSREENPKLSGMGSEKHRQTAKREVLGTQKAER